MDRIAEVQPDIAETLRRDRGQRFRHAVNKRLDPDESGLRVALGLCDQMLAAAEADLDAHLAHRSVEQGRERGRARAEVKRQVRQQRVEQRRLPWLQPVAFAPSEKGAPVRLTAARA
jgi:hypothetical protein